MAGPVGEAFVKIRPDFSTFEAELVAGLRAAAALTGGITVPVHAAATGAAAATAGVEGLTASTVPATAATVELTAAQRAEIEASLQQSVAAGELGTALAGLTVAEDAAATAALGLAGANQAAAAALRSGGVLLGGGGAAKGLSEVEAAAAGAAGGITKAASAGRVAAKGVQELTTAENALRGAVIGVSRITPVAIFGLGLAGTAAVAAAIGIRSAVEAAASFQEQLNVFQVVTNATADQMQRVSDLAKQLGADIRLPATSALDAAEAMTELGKAGLTVFQTMDAVRGVLQLAAAAGVNAGEAAKITAFALNAFALSGTKAVHVADLLAASSIAAQGEITDMALALEQSAAVAEQAGISIDDTATAISLLAKSGLIGSDAGTSLRTFLLRLVPTTKEATQFVKALGVEVADSTGKIRPLADIIQQYHDALATLPPVLQQAALQQIFGQDAIRAASILTREGAAGFNEMRKQVERQGAASELAGARAKGLGGSMKGLQSSVETLGLTLGQLIDGPLQRFVDSLTIITNAVTTATDGISEFVSKAAGAFGDLVAPDPQIPDSLRDLQVAAKAVADEIERIRNSGEVISPELIANLQKLDSPAEQLQNAIAGVQKQIDDFRKGGGDFVPPKLLAQLKSLQELQDSLLPSGLRAASVIEAVRTALGRLEAELAAENARQIKLDPFPSREDTAANARAFVAAAESTLKTLTTQLQAELKLLNRAGGADAKGTAAATARAAVLATVAELKKLGPAGEAAIADLPARLAKILKDAQTAMVAAAPDFKIPIQFQISANFAEISGDVNKQMADVNKRIAALQDSLAKEQAKAHPSSTRIEQITGFLAAATNQRRSLISQIEADAKQTASDAKTARDKADQLVLDALDLGRTRFDRAVEAAQGGDTPSALIRALRALHTRILSEIASAKDRIKDAATLSKELKTLNDDLFKNGQDLQAALKARDAAIDASFQKRVTLAQLQSEFTGNDAILVKALNAYIHFLRTVALPAAVKARKGVIDVKIAIQQLVNQKKSLNQDLNSESPDVFANRLFSEAADQFRRFGSNFSTSVSGLLSPQDARGQFAANLLPPGVTEFSRQVNDSTKAVVKLGDAAKKTHADLQKLFVVGKPEGLLKAGNIDLLHRPSVKNPKGGESTVLSFSVPAKEFGRGVGEILLPQVVKGRIVSEHAAVQAFLKTGQNLGQFATVKAANAYAVALHNQQARLGEQRRRDEELAEAKKQTAYLQIIAGGPRRVVTGTRVPPSVSATVANISANVLRGL